MYNISLCTYFYIYILFYLFDFVHLGICAGTQFFSGFYFLIYFFIYLCYFYDFTLLNYSFSFLCSYLCVYLFS